MTFQIAYVLLIMILMIIGLVMEIARPDMIIFATLCIFMLTGIISVDDALKGFSNEGMLTIALLFIVAGTIEKSGILDSFINRLMGSRFSGRWTLLKIITPIAAISGFMNNTPIVVMLTPVLKKWCSDHEVSPSKLLIPLSYATILGGVTTLIGTSTNLIVNGMLLQQGMKGFSFFELGIVGVPVAIVGLLYITLIGYKILPNHKAIEETVSEQSREYLAEMIVTDHFPYAGHSIADAGLRNLQGLYLIEIIRENERISPVKSSTKIKLGDQLIFTGLISTIAQLQNIKGLDLKTDSEVTLAELKNGNSQLVEAVVSHQSSLLFKKIKETQFRSQFDAGVIAVHRNSERIQSKIGDIRLKAGDTLLLLCGPDFKNSVGQTNDFYVTTPIEAPRFLQNKKKSFISVGVLLFMIALVTFNVLSMFKAMALAVLILLVTKTVTPEQAKNSIALNVLLLVACAFGIGSAMIDSGTAKWISSGIIHFGLPFGVVVILALFYLLTNIFTEITGHSAAAVIMFPIGISLASQLHVNPMAFVVALTIAASASFATPIGYQTNLIVYGPGGYKFKDYLKIGLPLNLLVLVVTVTIVHWVWM